jgi:hypothetical protein
MITLSYVGFFASVLFLAINIYNDLFRQEKLFIKLLDLISGSVSLICLTVLFAISLVKIDFLCIVAGINYFVSVYISNNEIDKKLKNSLKHQGLLGRYKKSDLPKTTKDYFLEYLTLIFSLLPFIAYLFTQSIK